MDIPDHVTLEDHLALITDYRKALDTINKLRLQLSHLSIDNRISEQTAEVSEIHVPSPS